MRKSISLFRAKKVYILFILIGIVALGFGYLASHVLRTYSIPFLTPTVKLTFAQEAAISIMEKCQTGGEQCYSNEFAKFSKTESIDTSLLVLDEVNKIDPNTRGCHLIAHSISTEATLKDIDNWEKVLGEVPADRCTGGFLHGIFEARQSNDPTIELSEKTIPEFCDLVKTKSRGGNDQDCSHIFGHLLVVVNHADLEVANAVCAKLPEGLQYECHSGVYMENETRDGIKDHGLGDHIPWNENTTNLQQELCEKATGTESLACWREISHMYVFISRDYPPDTYKLCQNAPDKDSVDACYQHAVGIMTASSMFNPENMKLLCKPYEENDDEYAFCVGMGIGSMLQSTPHFIDRVILLCREVPFRFQEGCFDRMIERLAHIVKPEELENYCKNVPYPYTARCENYSL